MEQTYSPYTTSNLGFTVTQPLLRGFGLAVNRRFIRIAKNEQKIAGLLLQQQLIATVYGVVRLYTDLVALYEDVKVKEETWRRPRGFTPTPRRRWTRARRRRSS